MQNPRNFLTLAVVCCALGLGCNKANAPQPANPVAEMTISGAPWLGIPSAVNQIVVLLHEGTGWLLNKSDVAVKKVSDVEAAASDTMQADFQITVRIGGETFETTAKDVPCDKDGIPTEAAVDRLRTAVEDIKTKLKRLQN